MSAARPFFALSPAEAEAFCAARGGRPFHARIVRREALDRGNLDYGRMSGLPAPLRRVLAEELPLLAGREVSRSTARDGTVKLLVGLARPHHHLTVQSPHLGPISALPPLTGFDDLPRSPPRASVAKYRPGPDLRRFPSRRGDEVGLDGGGTVESVYMPSRRSGRGATLCVSTQVGCPVGCPFCASGALGLERNLEAHEILEQFLRGRALGPLGRCVVMGIGEPLLNLANLEGALDIVRGEMGIGARRITVSTIGFPERVRRLALARPRFQLAISLHSPDDDERARLVPAMAGTPVEEVLRAGDAWFEATGREVTYEYVLLAGRNDSPACARRLAERLAGRRATVNLIPYNPVPGDVHRRPTAEAVAAFQGTLAGAGVVATVRWSRGVESEAACGQLRVRAAAGVP